MSSQIKVKVESYPECVKYSIQHHEPMIQSVLPDYPWQKIRSDLFHFKGNTYLLVVDYFSRYPEIIKLTSIILKSVIKALQSNRLAGRTVKTIKENITKSRDL